MKLKLIRDIKGKNYTAGKLYLNGEYFCDTLEDQHRKDGVKVPGETCIPEGTYNFQLYYSPKHKCLVPLLENVPMFTMIEIHVGNTIADTAGCILVGKRDKVTSKLTGGTSRITFNRLMGHLTVRHEAHTIEII